MPQVKYVGPFDEVELADGTVVKQGQTVDVDTDTAKGLREQSDNWQAAKKGDA